MGKPQPEFNKQNKSFHSPLLPSNVASRAHWHTELAGIWLCPHQHTFCPWHGGAQDGEQGLSQHHCVPGQGKLNGSICPKEILASLKSPGVSHGCAKPHHFCPSLGSCEVMSWAVLSWDPVVLHLKIVFQSLLWAVPPGDMTSERPLGSFPWCGRELRLLRKPTKALLALSFARRRLLYLFHTDAHSHSRNCILFWLFSTW